MSDAESVSSELEGPSKNITAITAAFCLPVSKATVSIVIMMRICKEMISFFLKHFYFKNNGRTISNQSPFSCKKSVIGGRLCIDYSELVADQLLTDHRLIAQLSQKVR